MSTKKNKATEKVSLFDAASVQRQIDSGVTTRTIIETILDERNVDLLEFLQNNTEALAEGDPMKLAELASKA